MKHILCYGDSNTYGFNGADCSRFDEQTRWTGVLQTLLGEEYKVIEEGLNSRTTVFEDPLAAGKNGLFYLEPCICSHLPIELTIVMLGTNDLKPMFSVGSIESAEGMARLLRTLQNVTREKTKTIGKVLVVSPIHVETAENGEYFYGFNEHSHIESLKMSKAFRSVAEELGADFMDAAMIAKPGKTDGIHLDPDGHFALANALAEYVKQQV